jgi:small subunit ribosomal protein S8
MSWSDPIADMLLRIRNAQKAGLTEVEMPGSMMKCDIARVFQAEGYIGEFTIEGRAPSVLKIALKYGADAKPVIRGIRRESRPGLRRFCGTRDIPKVLGGLGVAVLSTSGGVMSDKDARKRKLGGELICSIW